MRLSHLLPVVLLLILCNVDVASACSCAQPRPPCEAYGTASAVFLGRAVDSAERKSYVDESGAKRTFDVGRIRFLVQENFKGVSGYEVDIHTGTGGGDCGYWFLRNESYVVYAYRNSEDNKLYTSICARTKHISNAKEDLEFLRALNEAKPGATLYGRVVQAGGDRTHGPSKVGTNLPGVKIRIKGAGQTFEAVTDQAGEYRVTGLPPGDYDAFPQLPAHLGAIASGDTMDHFGSYSGHQPVTLSDRSCAELSFSVQFSGVVSGKVVDVNGLPAKDVEVNLALAEDSGKQWSARTDEEGRYEFRMVQPGNYLLGLNLEWAPTPEAPYPRTYYPGVKDKSEAGLIAMGEGEKLKGYDLTLPSSLIEQEVKVRVIWPDGKPAVGVSVYADASDAKSFPNRVETDEEGTAGIKLFEGHRYILVARAELEQDKYVHAEPLEIFIEKNTKPVRFVLDQSGYGYEKVDALRRKLRE